ncbi:hypothetical protein D5S17_12390 [Pseudonocardiaceae bacterium YIM PH 21723]|nr:hypothetical protein D5S17_12390 [Pseudonocardiaceae bacterium YIM PH 21723]
MAEDFHADLGAIHGLGKSMDRWQNELDDSLRMLRGLEGEVSDDRFGEFGAGKGFLTFHGGCQEQATKALAAMKGWTANVTQAAQNYAASDAEGAAKLQAVMNSTSIGTQQYHAPAAYQQRDRKLTIADRLDGATHYAND